jgi:uncharacterized lipoprotein YmbA
VGEIRNHQHRHQAEAQQQQGLATPLPRFDARPPGEGMVAGAARVGSVKATTKKKMARFDK